MIRRLHGLIPPRLRRPVSSVLRLVRLGRLSSDLTTFRTLYTLLVRDESPPGLRVVRLRPLGGVEFTIRGASTDAQVIWDTFVGRYHRPPPAVTRTARLILDLGANIGTTAADFAERFAEATVVAVELDPENAAVCRRNLRPWRSRVKVVEAAVWSRAGTVRYARESGAEWGMHVSPTGDCLAAAVTINELLDGNDLVDYVKVDVEGAERQIPKDASGWPEMVRAIKVEVHAGYTVEECAGRSALSRLRGHDRHGSSRCGALAFDGESRAAALPCREDAPAAITVRIAAFSHGCGLGSRSAAAS